MMWGKLMSLRSRGAGLFVLFATCVPYKKSDRPGMMTAAHAQLGAAIMDFHMSSKSSLTGESKLQNIRIY